MDSESASGVLELVRRHTLTLALSSNELDGPRYRASWGGRSGERWVRVPRRLREEEGGRRECLVPVRLEFEVEQQRMRDTFVWNLNDPLITPDVFAQSVVEDYGLPAAYHSVIVKSIQEQLSDFKAHSWTFDDPLALGHHQPFGLTSSISKDSRFDSRDEDKENVRDTTSTRSGEGKGDEKENGKEKRKRERGRRGRGRCGYGSVGY
ncbi:hypothetical protein NMY22_g19112 [Coprinellus aureogranulatus]|nr:hypothetical protein NMY22_g19112 [Coprinellus aureogranulatus]